MQSSTNAFRPSRYLGPNAVVILALLILIPATLARSTQKEYGFRNRLLLIAAEAPASAVNVALAPNGGTATASSAYSGWAASGTINGDRKGLNGGQNGAWSTAEAGFPAWLQVDFNGSKSIDEIDVFTIQDNWANPSEPTEAMTFSLYGLTGYDVQYWDGSAWMTVPGGSVSGNNKVWRTFTFPRSRRRRSGC